MNTNTADMNTETAGMTPWLQRRSTAHADSNAGFVVTRDDAEYQRDRARIIHSASFRSLQSKTQVLGLGESDFYRTRLTHSLEVAQIGSGLCEWLREQAATGTGNKGPQRVAGSPTRYEPDDYIPSFSLMEAICLAHDLGHSPFGHGGEVAMNTLMRAHGGFEANGQTLRILARLGEYSPHQGLDLTRRTMLGTIKYPAVYSRVCHYPSAPGKGVDATERHGNIDHWAPPKCLFDNESDVLDWLLTPFTPADQDQFLRIEPCPGRHARTLYKPFDTSIMELADDIAYGVHDLEDALALGLVARERWDQQVLARLQNMPLPGFSATPQSLTDELFSGSAKLRKHAISRLVSYLIRQVSITELEQFEHPLLRLQAQMQPDAHALLLLIKDFVMQHVILRPELQMLQYKGQQVVLTLFEIFVANPERLLPHEVQTQMALDGRRAIADYLAAMTDVSAGKLYHKLLSPSAGSIFDRT